MTLLKLLPPKLLKNGEFVLDASVFEQVTLLFVTPRNAFYCSLIEREVMVDGQFFGFGGLSPVIDT